VWNFGSRTGAGTVSGNYIFAGLTTTLTNVNNMSTASNILLVEAEATATDDIQQTLSFIDRYKVGTLVTQ
jgi:hypothetical protein